MLGVLKGSPYNKASYTDTLKMLNELFMQARKQGMVKLEEDVEDPSKSPVFSKYPKFLANHHAVHFVCDTIRMSISGGVPAFDLDQMMEMDMEVHHHESSIPVSALSTVADALPGLGIVAAVLGVVITMGSLGGPPEEIGHKVAAALGEGTFLGISVCATGFLGPPGVEHDEDERCGPRLSALPAARRDRIRKGIGPGAGRRIRAAQYSRRASPLL